MKLLQIVVFLSLLAGWSTALAATPVHRTLNPAVAEDVTLDAPAAKELLPATHKPGATEGVKRSSDCVRTSAASPQLIRPSELQDETEKDQAKLKKDAKETMLSMLRNFPKDRKAAFTMPDGTQVTREGLHVSMSRNASPQRDVDEHLIAWDPSASLYYVYSSSFTANTWAGTTWPLWDLGYYPFKVLSFRFLNYGATAWQSVGMNQDNSWYPTSTAGMQFSNYIGPAPGWAVLDMTSYNIYYDASRVYLHELIRWCAAGGSCNRLGADMTNPSVVDWDINSSNGTSWVTYSNIDWAQALDFEMMPDTGDVAYYFPFPIGSTVHHNTCGNGANSGVANDYTPPTTGPYAVGGGAGPDVIYDIYPGANVSVNITMTPTGFNGLIYLCTDFTNIPGTTIGASNVAGTGVEHINNVALTANTDYYLIVDGNGANDCGAFTLSISSSSLAPGNDTCSNPTNITLPYSVTTDTYAAADDYQGTVCGVTAHGGDRVYRYTPTANQALSITLTPLEDDFDVVLYVSTACPPTAAGQCVATADANGPGGAETIGCFLVTAGTSYYIFVDGYETDDKGPYTLAVSAVTPPTNDTCATAAPLTLGVDIASNTACSVDDYDGACVGSTQNAPDLVYSYTPTQHTTMAFILTPTDWDASIYIVTACSPTMSTCVAFADSFGVGETENLCVDLNAGTTYYIVVDGPTTGGSFTLYAQQTVRPDNDTCATATSLGPLDPGYLWTVDDYLSCATNDYDPTTTGCTGTDLPGPDVVYSYRPHTNQNVSIMVAPYYADWDIAVYVTTNCANLANCVGADNGLVGEPEFIHCMPMIADTTYYIIIDTKTENLFGRYYMELWPVAAAANETCATAQAITGTLPLDILGDTSCAVNDYSPTMSGCFSTSADSSDLVYSYRTGSIAETLTVVLDPHFYTGSVYVVTNCADLDDCVAGAYSDPPGAPVELPCLALNANTTYYIIVDGSLGDDQSGRFTLHLERTTAPANDVCASAQTITTFPATITGNTYCANGDYYYPGSDRNYLLGNDLVYHFNVATSSNYAITFTPADFTGAFLLISGTCPGGTLEDGYLIVDPGVTATLPCFAITGGTDYYIIVDGDQSYDFGHFTLTVAKIAAVPTNDTCASAVTIASIPYTNNGYTNCAVGDYDPGDGGCTSGFAEPGPDVVYRWTPAQTDWVTVTLTSAWDGSIYVLSPNCSDPVNNCLAGVDDYYGGHDEQFSFHVTAGVTYYFVVDSPSATEAGPFTFSIASRPIPALGPFGVGVLLIALSGILGFHFKKRK